MARDDPKYYGEAKTEYGLKLDAILSTLPPYCGTFFNAKRSNHLIRTLIGYAYDLKVFFYFLTQMNPLCEGMELKEIPFDLLAALGVRDIEEYAAFLDHYRQPNGRLVRNDNLGIRRKMSALSVFYNYFRSNEDLPRNPVEKYQLPEAPTDITIVKLEDDEVSMLLDGLATMSVWKDRELIYHGKTRYRDYAIYMLLLGTGIRVSELIGLNLEDIDFKDLRFRIIRKGNKKQDIWMSEEVADALTDYIEIERRNLIGNPNEPALFLSLQKRRITVRQIEKMTEQIAKKLFPNKNITPHKIRKTFGTSLYRETDDIYAVASALGHSSVETTRKHYADQDQEKIRRISMNHKIIHRKDPKL